MRETIGFVFEEGIDEAIEAEIREAAQAYEESATFLSEESFWASEDTFSRVVVCGSTAFLRRAMEKAHGLECALGIVPLSEQTEIIRTYALPTRIADAVRVACEAEPRAADMMYANGQIVLHEAVIGDVPPIEHYSGTYRNRPLRERIGLFWRTIRKVARLHHKRFRIADAEERQTSLSATGLVALNYPNETFAAKLLSSQIHPADGKVTMVILSPVSVMQYAGYLFRSFVTGSTPKKLPRAMGYMRAPSFRIETEEAIEATIDGETTLTFPLEIETRQKAIRLCLSDTFWERGAQQPNEKNSIKTDHLPGDEETTAYLQKHIPLFTHASQEQYASLFASLREEAAISATFMTLLILATLIATLGLFIDSASVIIGAMLLAPLMQPIVSLAMGLLRQDVSLQSSAAKSIAVGVASVLASAAVVTWLTPMHKLTAEMAGRLSPTLLDLFVAVVSGAAAAYAKSNEKISSSLAGVAIAVALVPPIAVAGIGIGWGDWSMFVSSFLLFVTNLAGIVLAAAVTFLVLGYAPLHIARKGVTRWLVVVAIVTIPLYRSFETMKTRTAIEASLSGKEIMLDRHTVRLQNVHGLPNDNGWRIETEIVSDGVLDRDEKRLLRKKIEKRVGKPCEITATFRYAL